MISHCNTSGQQAIPGIQLVKCSDGEQRPRYLKKLSLHALLLARAIYKPRGESTATEMRTTTRSPSSPVELPTVTAVDVRIPPTAQTSQYHREAGRVSRRRCNCYIPPRGTDFHKIGQEINKRNRTRFNSDPIPNTTVMLPL